MSLEDDLKNRIQALENSKCAIVNVLDAEKKYLMERLKAFEDLKERKDD